MTVYFAYYFFLLGIGVLLYISGTLQTRGGRISYMCLVWLVLTIIGSLRSYSVSYDGYAYAASFDYFARIPWKTPWNYSYFMEYGFYVLCKLISILGGTARTMYFITSAFTLFSMCYFLYRNSENLLFSTAILLSFPYFYTSFDLIRYYLALSIVLLAFDFVKARRFIPYLLCILLAMQFHKTAIIMLGLYFLPKIKWNFLSVTVTVVLTLIATLFAHDIAIIFSLLFNDYKSYVSGDNAHWIGSFSGGLKTALMYVVLLMIAIMAYQNKREPDRYQNQCLGYIILVASVALMFINSSIALRLLIALLPFMSVSMTKLLDDTGCHNQNTQFFLRYVMTLMCLAYHTFLILNDWQNIVPYTIY